MNEVVRPNKSLGTLRGIAIRPSRKPDTFQTRHYTQNMTRIQPLGRSIEQLSRPTRPSHVCRSCRLRLAGSQQRQLHTSGNETSSPGHAPSSTSTASNDTDSRSHENAKAATWNVVSSKQLRRRVSKNSLPLTLVAKDPSKDPDYVQAVSSEGLERVGSRKWIEKQLDVRDRYVGYDDHCRQHTTVWY